VAIGVAIGVAIMEFDNSFEVPLPADDAWKVLMDIRRIVPCMPGAELTEVVDDRTYKGKIGVRLGPVAGTFAGTGKFEEIDDANHRARVAAQGSDAKGRGSANASATFHLEPANGGSKVLVHTNLTLSGAVAQYGRGVGIIQMTAAQIITQFANNLKAQLGPASTASTPAAASVAAPAATPATDRAGAQPAAPAVAAPTAPAKPISGFALMSAVLLAWIKRLLGRG
jgi:carbon monoxide dehydrogenase subunit G